jgi:putative ABC transport system permease protein
MNFRDLVELATDAPRRHGLRSALCVAGIAVGVAAVLLLTALGEGARHFVVREFVGLGANLVIVMPGKIETTGLPAVPGGTTRDLTIDDAIAIGRRSPAVARVAPVVIGTAPVEHGDRGRSAVVVGTTPEYLDMRDLVVAGGRSLPGGDPRRGERVCIVGPTVAAATFGSANPLGGTVRIGEWRFRVIGVLEPKGRMLGMDLDELVLVPVATAMRMFNRTTLFRVLVQARSPGDVDRARTQVHAVLYDRHDRHEDYTVVTQGALVAAFTSILRALTAALAAIAGISLLVAGVGIMNVMLVAVAERTAEVGLEKALGARPSQIGRLFLAEAVVIAAAGAALGVVLGALGIRIATALHPELPARLQGGWLAAVIAIALATGAAFGALPARRAARVEAALALARKA